MYTENLPVLTIHKLSTKQYKRELAAGNIDETALYLTPDDNKIITVTQEDNLVDIIASAQSGTTISLTTGIYPLLLLSGKESFPDNLTIVGGTDVNIAGVSITSGLNAYSSIQQTTNSDIAMATMSKNLTFKNITFSSSFCVRNCDISGLTIQDCIFEEGTCFQLVPNRTLDYHGNDGSATLDTIPYYATRRAHNTIIKGCTFINANITDETTAIYAISVDGLTIHKNVIEAAAWNAIQINGTDQANRYDALSTGRIAITNNIIRNTGSRSMRLLNFENADIYIAYNKLYSADRAESNGIERIKIAGYDSSTTITTRFYVLPDKVTIDSNTYEDVAIGVGSGITLSQNKTDIEKSIDNLQSQINNFSEGGIYIGSGDMPENCNLQIDPNGQALTIEDLVPNPLIVTVSGTTPSATNAQIYEAVQGGRDIYLLLWGDTYLKATFIAPTYVWFEGSYYSSIAIEDTDYYSVKYRVFSIQDDQFKQNYCNLTKLEDFTALKTQVGDIDTALDNILAIQSQLIGGSSV